MPINTQSIRKPSRVYLRRGHPLTKGLVGCWPFFAGAGNTLRDISGHNNHGSFNGDPVWDIGPRGAVVDFDGSSDYIQIPGSGALNTFSNISISLWMNVTADDSMAIMGFNRKSSSDLQLYYEGGSGDNLKWGTFAGAGPSTSITEGDWVHAVGTFKSADTLELFINGESVGTDTTSRSVNNSGEPWLVATDADSSGAGSLGNYFTGRIANLLIFDKIMSPGEARQLYEQPLAPFITKPR